MAVPSLVLQLVPKYDNREEERKTEGTECMNLIEMEDEGGKRMQIKVNENWKKKEKEKATDDVMMMMTVDDNDDEDYDKR